MKIRAWLLTISIPITKLIAKIARPAPRITTPQLLEIRNRVKNGDVLVCRVNWELSNLFLPGKWKHCGVYINGFVYESTTQNVKKTLLEEFCFKKDYLGICRLKDEAFHYNLDYLKGISFLEENLGEEYDYGFRWGVRSSWYCSKFVFFYLRECSLYFSTIFQLRETLGEPTVTPTDFWLASKIFEQIYEC